MSTTKVYQWHHVRIFTTVPEFIAFLGQHYDVEPGGGQVMEITTTVDQEDMMIELKRLKEKDQ